MPLPENNNYDAMNQGIDRITEILKQQSTPAPFSSYMPQAMGLPANLLNAIAYSSYDPGNGKGGNFVQNAQNFQHTMQADQLGQQEALLKTYEMKLKMGDAQTKALDDKITLFTGNDQQGKALFLQALHDDPESIDPTNSYQVMTKLAGIKKKTGYESPDLMLQKQKETAAVQLLQAQANKANAEATRKEAGAPAPSGYIYKPDGTLTFIPGGPADPANKPLTEVQGKAGLFASRMQDAEPIIEKLGGTVGTNLNERTKASIPIAGNYLVSPDYQSLEQAERNFVNATLRQESGASISASEFENAVKQYFPRPGDKPDVIAQKAQNRATAIEQMGQAAGAAYKKSQLTHSSDMPGKLIGTSGGKKVYELPDGSHVMEQ